MMVARSFLPLLVLFLLALYVVLADSISESAPKGPDSTLEELCRNYITLEKPFCQQLLKPVVSNSSLKFGSLEWNRAMLAAAISKVESARDFMQKAQSHKLNPEQKTDLDNCLSDLEQSVQLLHKADLEYVEMYKFTKGTAEYESHKQKVRNFMDNTSYNTEACYDSLEGGQIDILREVRKQSDDAYTANKMAADIIFHYAYNN